MTEEEERIFQKLHALGVAGQRPEKLFLRRREKELREALDYLGKILGDVYIALYSREETNGWHDGF